TGRCRQARHHRPTTHPAPEPTMALVRPTNQWTAKPRSPQLNSTPQHHRPRTRTTGDTAPKTTHARHRKPTTQQNQPPINSTHERSRLGQVFRTSWRELIIG